MKRLIILTILSLMLFKLSFGLDAEVTSFHITLDLTTGVSSETISVTANNPYNESTNTLYVLLEDSPYRLEINDGTNRIMNFSSFVTNGVFTIKVYDVIPSNSSKVYNLVFLNDKVVRPIEDYYLMTYSFNSFYDDDDFSMIVKLPSGFGITQRDGGSVSPQPSHLYSDGQQIIIEWNERIEYGESGSYMVFFEKLTTPSVSFEGFVIVGFICFVAGFVLSQIMSRRKRKEIVAMTLTGDEKKVVDLVLKSKTILYQNDIEKGLDFSKPKLSKIIHFLETKSIIFVTPVGRKNKIELNKKMI
ncbi:Uncharacterised protein [Candidatus Tiddalikarchaeum anstoanum]|nr:Uncharacterised protein [Candidatus Tiddalikarchaeum anstoanum]